MGNFSPVNWNEILENQNCAYPIAWLSLVTLLLITNKAYSHSFEVEIHTLQNYCESEAILSKMFPSGYLDRNVHLGMFGPVTKISEEASLDNRASLPFYTNKSKFQQRKLD